MGTTKQESCEAEVSRPTYEELVEENGRLKRQVEQLTREIERLTRLVEKLEGEGRRQAAPFRKRDEPAAKPKKSGRKRGRRHGRHAHRAIPPRIDETIDVPLPPKCPHCQSERVHETSVAVQFQTEIPRAVIYRRFDVHVGGCRDCGRTVQGRHDLQTSTARGAAASQFGPNVHVMLAVMNKQGGLSHGKCVKLLNAFFDGLSLTRGASVRSMARTARRCRPAYEQLRGDVKRSAWLVPDETGWRVGGRNAWLHVFAAPRTTCYVIDPTRSVRPAEQLLGLDWSGTLVHDGWSVYDGFRQAFHQQCLQHLQRRCESLLRTARGGAVRLPRSVLTLIDLAYRLRRSWRGHRLDRDGLAEQGLMLGCRLESLASGSFTNQANRRLAAHLRKHAMHWFWFLIDPTLDATNSRAEQAIRPAVVNRKVWGGNRTWPGATTQSILTSVLHTCEQRAADAFDFLAKALCQPNRLLLPA